MPNSSALTPALALEILQGHRDLIIWGGTDVFTAHEWQRQIPATFMVDTRWNWWSNKTFHGLDARSPSEIEGVDSKRAVVINNFFYNAVSPQIPAYLARIGNPVCLDPTPLKALAERAALEKRKSFPTLENDSHFVEKVNKELQGMLVAPAQLGGKSSLPGLESLLSFFNGYSSDTYLQQALRQLSESQGASLRPRKKHVCLFVSSISPGGAERQLCNLAIGLKRSGWTPTILCATESRKLGNGAYLRALAEEGVPVEIVCPPTTADDPTSYLVPRFVDVPQDVQMALWHLPATHMLKTLCLYHALRRMRPELFIAYLDGNNIPGGYGALLAGVPRVFLSGRSTARPQLYIEPLLKLQDLYAHDYRTLASQERVVLSNNSPGGAASYAEWTGLPVSAFPVVRNCVSEEFTRDVPSCFLEARRLVLALKKNQPFILGVFRLHHVKRPMDFVQVIAALHKKNPNLRAAICGSLDFDVEKIRALIHKLKLDSVLTLLGAAEDVPTLMQTATILLHTAEIEGSPNVVLEAQSLGLPVVAAENTGVQLCLNKAWTPYMKKPGDIKGLARSCQALLDQPALRRRLVVSAKKETRKSFSIKVLTANTLAVAGINPKATNKKREPS